nr:hypothetical protein [Amycolatopsis rubida]
MEELRGVFRAGSLPDPVNDARCDRCSLKDNCMPAARVDTSNLFTARPMGDWDD